MDMESRSHVGSGVAVVLLPRAVLLALFLGVVSALIFTFFVRPQQRFESAQLQNSSNIEALQRAIDQWKADHDGALGALFASVPGGVGALKSGVAANGGGTARGGSVVAGSATASGGRLLGSGAGEVNLCNALVPIYLGAMPYDMSGAIDRPDKFYYKSCASYETGYRISVDAVGRVVIASD